jgi:hypothetical protein
MREEAVVLCRGCVRLVVLPCATTEASCGQAAATAAPRLFAVIEYGGCEVQPDFCDGRAGCPLSSSTAGAVNGVGRRCKR